MAVTGQFTKHTFFWERMSTLILDLSITRVVNIFLGKGCPRLESSSSLLAPVVSTESSFVQMVSDIFDTRTVSWKTVTILYDSTEMIDETLLKEMMMQLQQKISIVMFDISIKSFDEMFGLKSSLGKNFFVIGKQNMALNIFNIVRKIMIIYH